MVPVRPRSPWMSPAVMERVGRVALNYALATCTWSAFAFASDPWCVGDATPRRAIVAPLAAVAPGKTLRGTEVTVAIPFGTNRESVTVATAELKEVSALWGLALVELGAHPPRDATFRKVTTRTVPIQLGEWLTRPAGLDAVEIASPSDLPLGTWIVDEKRRFVGIVSRLAHSSRLILIRPRTINLFASADVSTNVAPVVPASPNALVVDEPRVRDRVAKLELERQSRPTAPSLGPHEFALETPEARDDAESLLRTGGVVLGGASATQTLVVVLPSTGGQLTAMLDHLSRALENAESVRAVVHFLPTSTPTPTSRETMARACAIANGDTQTWTSVRTALTRPMAEAPRCSEDGAESFWQAETDLLQRAQVDEPILFINETVLAPQEPVSVIRAALGLERARE